MNKVQVVPTKANIAAGKATQLITMFSGKETGFIKLEAKSIDMSNPVWPRVQTRVSTMKGTKEILDMVVAEAKANKGLPGRLQLIEVKASEVTKELRDLFFNKDIDEDDNITQYSKRAGSEEDAPVLTLDEVPILRFTKYDPTGSQADVTLAYDNVEEVQAYRASKVGELNLPGEVQE